MTSDDNEDAFVAEVAAHPEAADSRVVLADLLEDRGRPALAAYLREPPGYAASRG